jgi:hypothetical protein
LSEIPKSYWAAEFTGTRDYQRSKVEAQGMVNAIWAKMGLKYPPAVELLPKQARPTVASASRLMIFLPEQTPSWCLLHEISHAMTSTAEGHSN